MWHKKKRNVPVLEQRCLAPSPHSGAWRCLPAWQIQWRPPPHLTTAPELLRLSRRRKPPRAFLIPPMLGQSLHPLHCRNPQTVWDTRQESRRWKERENSYLMVSWYEINIGLMRNIRNTQQPPDVTVNIRCSHMVHRLRWRSIWRHANGCESSVEKMQQSSFSLVKVAWVTPSNKHIWQQSMNQSKPLRVWGLYTQWK